MIKKTGFIITLFLLSINSFSQKRFARNDSLYIWALNGLNIRETSDLNSKILKTIQYGEIVTVDSIYESNIFELELIKQVKVQNNNDNIFSEEKKSYSFSAKGQMIKVNYKGINGYVFSGLISRLKPVNNLIYLYTINDYFEKEYGVFAKFENKDEFRNFDQIIYKNGVNLYLCNGPGFFDTTYTLFNISFNECMLLVYIFIERTNRIVEKSSSLNGKWYINSISEDNISFSEETGMYHASVSRFNNLIYITVSGSN